MTTLMPVSVKGQGVTETTACYGITAGAIGLLITFALSRRAADGKEKGYNLAAAEEDTSGNEPCDNQDGNESVSRTPPCDPTLRIPASKGVGEPTRVDIKRDPARRAVGMTRPFLLFQRSYLSANVVACFADWLKGAYTMSIYAEFGFTLQQISLLFTVAFFSSVVFGTIAGAVSDTFGRARSCRVYCLMYAASLLLTTLNDARALCLARALSGISTSLLTTAFESWVVTEHHTRGFEAAWLQDTFAKAAVFGSASAVLAGFVAEAAVRAVGNVGPFLAPLPFLGLALFLMRNWTENYGDRSVAVWRTLLNGWHEITQSHALRVLLLCEALYEGGLGIWLVMWTPALDSTNNQTPFGLVFAAYTLCMVSGGLLARVLTLTPLLFICHGIGVLSMLLSALLFECKVLVFASFMLYELSTGVYHVAHPTLRSSVMSDSSRASVMNLFRIPMNLIVVATLLLGPSPQSSLWLLVGFQLVSMLSLWWLQGLRK